MLSRKEIFSRKTMKNEKIKNKQNNHESIKRKAQKKNVRHRVETCVRIFIVNNANYSRKFIFVVYKSMRSVLLSIVDIMTRVVIHQSCDKNTLFILRQNKRIKKKISFSMKNTMKKLNFIAHEKKCNTIQII